MKWSLQKGGPDVEVAIIGFGASGVNVFRHLINNQDKLALTKIYIIQDPKNQFARGLPYREDHESMRLNTQPHAVSMDADNKEEFTDFLKTQGISYSPEDFLPRPLFGRYLKQLYQEVLSLKYPMIRVQVINQEAIGVKITGHGYLVDLADGQSIQVQSIQLCLGHLAYNDPYHLKGKDRYVYNPYPILDKLKNVQSHDRLAIIGAGLTALDLFVYLKNYKKLEKIDVFSLEGLAKTPRGLNYQHDIQLNFASKSHLVQLAQAQGGFLTAEDLFAQLRQEALHHGIEDFDYLWHDHESGTLESLASYLDQVDKLNILQTILIAFKTGLNPVWNHCMTREERSRFFELYGDRFNLYLSPIPQNRARELVKAGQESYLSVYSDMEAVQLDPDGKFIIQAQGREYASYDYLVNACGQATNIEDKLDMQGPLVQQLVQEGLAQTDPLGGFHCHYPSFSLVHPQSGPLASFKVYGQLASGIDPFNNSIEKLSYSTKMGVEDLVRTWSVSWFLF